MYKVSYEINPRVVSDLIAGEVIEFDSETKAFEFAKNTIGSGEVSCLNVEKDGECVYGYEAVEDFMITLMDADEEEY